MQQQEQHPLTAPPVIRAEVQARGWSLTGAVTDEGPALRYYHTSSGKMIAWARHTSKFLVREIAK